MSKSTAVDVRENRVSSKSKLSVVAISILGCIIFFTWRAGIFRDHSFIGIPDIVVTVMALCVFLVPIIMWVIRRSVTIDKDEPKAAGIWSIPNGATLLVIGCLSISGFIIATRMNHEQFVADEFVRFSEESLRAGIQFTHSKPTFDAKVSNIMPWLAAVGASASAADYDGSGRVSVFLTRSAFNTEDGLFRNVGVKDGVPQFVNVTDEVGLSHINDGGVSMAAAWGDYDNDGFPDLYVVRAGGGNLLFHNVPVFDANGQQTKSSDGTPLRKFVNVTPQSNTGNVGYGVGALWFDYDRDGKLDLVVADYFASYYSSHVVQSSNARNKHVPLDLWHLADTRFMPDSFNNARNGGGVLVFHNDGGGHFSEVHDLLGMKHTGFALAIGAADLNDDGWPDLYVANDFGPDDLYINSQSRSGSREFVRVEGGFTADKIGRDTKKGMNVDFGDVDHNGSLAVYVTNITHRRVLPEGNMLWTSREDSNVVGGRNFDNRAERLGVNDCGWSWGGKFADVNNDGWNDIIVANGFISASKSRNYWYELQNMASDYHSILEDAAQWPEMRDKSLSGYQRTCLFVRKQGRFIDMAKDAGIVDDLDGRGVAIGDFDNDGAVDFAVSNQGQPTLLYVNQLYRSCQPGHCPHWIGLHLVGNGTTSNKDAIGARVQVFYGNQLQTAEVARGNGFASQSDPRIHFGLGASAEISSIKIRWPDGREQEWKQWKIDSYSEVYEGP